MPAPQASLMKQIAKQLFIASGIALPTDWSLPTGDPAAKHYTKAFKENELACAIPPVPPGLFLAASSNKYNCVAAKEISGKFEAYIDGVCDAICMAWSQWQMAATLVGVVINAVTASLGQVVGPPLTPIILAQAPKSTPQEIQYSNAIAQAIGTAWITYTATIKVPGLPWYPAFASVPAPVAPPMPNVPMPVIALTQATAAVSQNALKGQMIANLGDASALHSKELFDCIAGAFENCFTLWQASTMVSNVMGTGPVPTFAPPVVPVGPVVGGVGVMIPGGFV
jgi:hypothetical protein